MFVCNRLTSADGVPTDTSSHAYKPGNKRSFKHRREDLLLKFRQTPSGKNRTCGGYEGRHNDEYVTDLRRYAGAVEPHFTVEGRGDG